MSDTYEIIDSFVVNGLLNQRIQLTVPLDYGAPAGSQTISISANITQKYMPEVHTSYKSNVQFPSKKKVIAFLQGGPGFSCPVPVSNGGFPKVLIDKNYQIVLYDQRGTGLSSPIEAETLARVVCTDNSKKQHFTKLGSSEIHDEAATAKLLDYVLHFRADSIVQDMERVRSALLGKYSKWSLLGQSYGGFCCFTYLSRYPESLNEVFVTGGIPPIGLTADDVYRQTYMRTRERNIHYYSKYPQDIDRVKEIVQYLRNNDVELPNGGTLSVERFQQLGIRFGGSGGTDGLHCIVTELWYALRNLGKPTYSILNAIQQDSSFDTNIIYALFQEAIYCDGAGQSSAKKTDWAAERCRYLPANKNFVVNDALLQSEAPVYFTGEMVYKSMYDDYSELAPLKSLAHALHENENWSALYDVDVLAKISWDKVPIVAATYYYDQYVDFDTSMDVKHRIFKDNGNLKQYITSEFFHNGLRANSGKVLGSLFKLLECEVD